ncbi:hypothetical protein EQV77_13410 [Halobacillus fulvus]|nr:hypothetical protein EQV77_13410 [Halobacillus fulvus]
MSGNSLFFLVAAVALAVLIPFFVVRDLKKGKKLADVITSNAMLLALLIVAVGQGLRPLFSEDGMVQIDQWLFSAFILFIVVPLVVILFYYVKRDLRKWSDPEEYKFYWAYKVRYLLIAGLAVMVIIALYRFYLIFEVVF